MSAPSTNEALPSHPAYRADIDGLRAVAVLAVVAYHAFPDVMRGGFIGVDIFFVISGFLITGIVFRSLEDDRFSFIDFYARRARRIFPALALVLTLALVAGRILSAALDPRQLAAHVAAGAGFVSNLLLWSEAGYFDASAHAKPLLHLWSLGIEEQFYLVWPLLLTLAWRRGWSFLTVMSAIATASFSFNLVTVADDPVAAFYAPHARFWQLMAGGILAYLSFHRPQALVFSSASRSFFGLLAIALGLLSIDEHSRFPGWWALLPTLGAFLVIAAGPDTMLNRRLLGNRFMAGIGLISYPLYLWHWPLLCYLRIAEAGVPSAALRGATVLAAFILAWLTYVFVERPIRRAAAARRVALVLSLIMAELLAIGLLFYGTSDSTFSYDWQRSYRFNQCFVEATRPEVNASSFASFCSGAFPEPRRRPLVLLWGDSHAASLYHGLHYRARLQDFELAQFNASACPPVVGYHSPQSRHCTEINQFVVDRITELRPETVILAAYWSSYWLAEGEAPRKGGLEPAKLQATVRSLVGLGVKDVVVVGPLPSFDIGQPAVGALLFEKNKLDRTWRHFNRLPMAVDGAIAKATLQAGAKYVSPHSLLCNPEGCLISASKAELIPLAWDYGHLTDAGARLLVDLAVRDRVLPLPGK